jgi:hypothetical protein
MIWVGAGVSFQLHNRCGDIAQDDEVPLQFSLAKR